MDGEISTAGPYVAILFNHVQFVNVITCPGSEA